METLYFALERVGRLVLTVLLISTIIFFVFRVIPRDPALVIVRHIIPNLLGRVVVQGSITFALAVVVEASLSSWAWAPSRPRRAGGLMLKDARDYLVQAPWMALYPGIALVLTVLSFNVLGDTLSEKLNPKL